MTLAKKGGCGCAAGKSCDAKVRSYVDGVVQSIGGPVPRITTRLTAGDYLGALMVRMGFRRNRYRVDPGLYAVGSPGERSDVLVTANYKLTFDIVRKNLAGLHVWLLVLDTKGINVWCAAGKGTFGTAELVHRIHETGLENVVLQRRLVLPQLGAVGVAAHVVKQQAGFTVLYGPVRAADIRTFLDAGHKATEEMRRVRFGLYDRFKLIPNDALYGIRFLAAVAAVVFVLSGIGREGFLIQLALERGLTQMRNLAVAYAGGIVMTPLLLPFIPFRSFAMKGFIVGLVLAGLLFAGGLLGDAPATVAASFLFMTGLSSFVAMNFTGSSTFTSLSGVKKEMRTAVPLQIGAGVVAAALLIVNTIV